MWLALLASHTGQQQLAPSGNLKEKKIMIWEIFSKKQQQKNPLLSKITQSLSRH